ncbi:MAG: uracil-DNA glycosylase [Candidatus Bathyarchaeia archaeon]
MPERRVAFKSLNRLNSVAVSCELCPRLRRYCKLVAKKKRRQFTDWNYWGKPLPGFGDAHARLLILGLAPAAHGGNRTGRMFTGDGSAQFLMAALHRHGFSNQPTSNRRGDGLELHDAYMTAIVRCAPPKNRPTLLEIRTCERYWTQELRLLTDVKVILALGRVAFETYVRFLREQGLKVKGLRFHHAAFYELPAQYPALAVSYHPSRQNTQTGKLTEAMFTTVFLKFRRFLDLQSLGSV